MKTHVLLTYDPLDGFGHLLVGDVCRLACLLGVAHHVATISTRLT